MIFDQVPHRSQIGLVTAKDRGIDRNFAGEEAFGIIFGAGRIAASFKHGLEAFEGLVIGVVAHAKGGPFVTQPAIYIQ